MASVFAKLNVQGNEDNVVSDGSRLTNHYPAAYKDFYGLPSHPPCVYKSGPAWREPTGLESFGIFREARPVYDHPISDQWHVIGTSIYEFLDSQDIKWTSIDPVAFAEEGEVKPFCPLLMWIGVYPRSLLYEVAVAAAEAIKKILAQDGFPEIEVAFRESVVTRSVAETDSQAVALGPKLLPFNPLLSFDPLLDPVPELLKPFTPTLGLSIAPLKAPYYEGTGALYLHVSSANKHTVLLTAAHVARPPPAFANTGMLRRYNSWPARERIIALGDEGYSRVITSMLSAIHSLALSIDIWNDNISRLSKYAEGEEEDRKRTEKCQEYLGRVDKAKKKIKEINKLHSEVTKLRTTPAHRTIGFVLHVERIAVSDGPHKFTRDWALIELHEQKFDWDSFKGNKIYVGNLSPYDYRNIMFPRPEDWAGYKYPYHGLLQAHGVVKDEDIRSPRQLDANGYKCLPVVKNGLATGTTVGRVNGLDSFTRNYADYDIKETSVEVAVLPYDRKRGAFSAPGDSGAIVLERGGGIVGMLIGGGGALEENDIAYMTPYWWLDEQIKKVFPDYYLYDIVE